MGRIYTFTIILMIFIPGCLFAQTYLKPEIISIEEGLSSHHVNDIAFDDAGFLWAATSKGLNRYDGYGFKQFLVPQSSFPVQAAYDVTKLSVDSIGNIWFLSASGPGVYASETGKITLYEGNVMAGLSDADNEFIDVIAGEDMTAWVLSDEDLIQVIPGGLAISYSLPEGPADRTVVPTCMATDGSNIWIGCEHGAIYFDMQSRFLNLDLPANPPSSGGPLVHCVFTDGDNTIWFGTDNGLTRYDHVDLDYETFYPEGTMQGIPGNDVLDISVMRDGRLLLVTGAGIKVFDRGLLHFEDIGDVEDNRVYAAASDMLGNIWCAASSGILKMRITNLIVDNYDSSSSYPRLASDQVTTLQTLSDYSLWVGHGKEGFDILDTRTNAIRHRDVPSGEEIRRFYKNANDQMIAMDLHNLAFYGQNGNRQYLLTDRFSFVGQELLNRDEFNCILQDRNGRLWIGTSGGMHLVLISSNSHTYMRSLPGSPDSIRLSQVYDIKQDANGDLWLGTDNGLIVYDPEQHLAVKHNPYDRNLMNTENKSVFTMVSQDSSNYWIGTSRGIFRFNIHDREFTAPNDPSLMNASVYAITINRYEHLWIGTDIGLFYYMTASGSILFFDPVDGLINYSYTSSAMDGDGKVYAGGEHGLSVVDIARDERDTISHKVVITGIYWIDQETREEIDYAVQDTVILPKKRNALEISFAVLDLSRPENNDFSFTFARTGRNAGSFQPVLQHHIILNPLSQGRYVLTVRGSNSNMVWSREDTTLVIIIEPPFWKSRLALALYGIVIILLLFYGFVKLSYWFSKMSQQGKEKELIAKQIMEQKEELSLKNKSITDSINYAKRIQTAMLPPVKMLKTDFPSSFILYMPKDIVSGDFYWINKMDDNKIFIAAVDCTGHGVPGAFMSIIGFELFRKITNIEGLKRPSDILNRLNEDFHELFKDVDVVLRDGMDVAFCSIDKSNKILEFSGAFNPLYLIRDNKITEIKGDRFAIGLDEIDFMDQTFKNHLIPLQEGDIIYIFSDGFADQFGGPDGKKYKYRRFKHLLLNLHKLEMEKQREILESNVVEWRGEQEQVDDILIIGIKIDF